MVPLVQFIRLDSLHKKTTFWIRTIILNHVVSLDLIEKKNVNAIPVINKKISSYNFSM